MPNLSEDLKRIWANDSSLEIDRLLGSKLSKMDSLSKTARDNAKRMVYWYNRNRLEIVKALKATANKTFGGETDDWQFPVINGVPRTIQRLSTAYKDPPKREYVRADSKGKETVLKSDSAEVQKVERMYKGLDLDAKLTEADRFSTLLNTIHIEPVYRNDAIDWDIHLRPKTTIIENPTDYLEFQEIAFAWFPMNPANLIETKGWIYWSADRHIYITEKSYWIGLTSEDGSNPYDGKIPIVTIRKIEADEYWGAFGEDIVDAFEQSNIQLAALWENMFFQTYGQPFGTNLGIKGPKVKLGWKNPILVDKVTKDDLPPKLEFPKPEPDIAEVQDVIDWLIKSSGAAYGLPPSAWSLEETRLSGFAKFIDNLELLEQRENDLDKWIAVEEQLFDYSRLVWNRWADGRDKVPEDIQVRVTFPAVEFPQEPADEIATWNAKITANLASEVDYFMHVEGLDEADAIKRAKRIRELKKEIRPETPTLPTPPGIGSIEKTTETPPNPQAGEGGPAAEPVNKGGSP